MTNKKSEQKVELYKIVIKTRKKCFYETKKAFEQHWNRHVDFYSPYYDIIGYKLENMIWKEIRKSTKEPTIRKPPEFIKVASYLK